MKYLPLIWRNLLRRKVRTIFTLASVFIAFLRSGKVEPLFVPRASGGAP